MGKLTTYLFLMTGLLLLFHFTGLLIECTDELCTASTPVSALLNVLIHPEGMRETDLALKAILSLQGAAAIVVVGLSAYLGNVELAIMGGYAIFLFNLLWDFIAVFNIIREAHPALAVIGVLIFAPFIIDFTITIVDWWRGRA